MQKKIFIVFLLFFLSCSGLKDPKGKYNEVVFICSDEDRKICFKQLEKIFSEIVHTPTEEHLYETKWIDPLNFKNYLNYRNLIFISIADPPDSTIDILVDNFKDEYSENIFILNDVYAKNQNLLFFSFKDSLSMHSELLANEEWIIENIDLNIFLGLDSYVYRNGRNIDIEDSLKIHYNLDAKVQKDYMFIKNHSSDNEFLWIGRGYPYRWVTIKKINYLDELFLWDKFKDSILKDMPNVEIVDFYKNILYESDDIIKIQGLYEEIFSDSGGPFISYVKLDRETKEALIVSGFANNPGKNKNRLLKELEIQIKNIIGEYKNEK